MKVFRINSFSRSIFYLPCRLFGRCNPQVKENIRETAIPNRIIHVEGNIIPRRVETDLLPGKIKIKVRRNAVYIFILKISFIIAVLDPFKKSVTVSLPANIQNSFSFVEIQY